MARSRSTSRRTATPRPAVGVAQPARSLLLAALGLAAAAFALRCVAIAEIDQLPLIRSPQLDSLEFLSWAREIVNGNPQWPAPPTHGPTYPYVLAFLLQITGGSLYAVRLCQAAIGAGS